MSCSCNHKDVDNDAWVEETLIKFIKCLCSCGPDGPSEPGETLDCVATFLTGSPIDGFPEFITYSKNGGPFREIRIYDSELDGTSSLVAMLKNESLTGFAFSILDGFYDNRNGLIEFCGLSSDGSFVSSVEPNGIKPIELFLPDGIYPGPFNVIAEKNTLTFKETEGVSFYKDFFHCLDKPDLTNTLTLESCAVLEILNNPLPPPILT